MVLGTFPSISATEALYENLHSHYKTFRSALLAMEEERATVTLSELQIQNSQGKSNTRHLQNKTENLLHLPSESWYFKVSNLLIISPLQYSPPQLNHMPSSPYMPQWGFVGAYLTFMQWNCSLQVPTRSPRKTRPLKNNRNTEDSPMLQLRQQPSLHESSILYGNVVTL